MITCEVCGADGQYETLRKMTLYDPEEKENRSHYLCDNCYAKVVPEIDALITRMRKTYDMYNKGKARLVREDLDIDDILKIPNKYREGMVRGPIIGEDIEWTPEKIAIAERLADQIGIPECVRYWREKGDE